MNRQRTGLDLLVFDYDGTICDSTNAKTEAFYALYLDEHGPAFAERVRQHHLEHAGESRFTKIRYVENQLLGREVDEARVAAMADRFGDIVREMVVNSRLMPGVEDFLACHLGAVAMTVASATPTDELRSIVAAHGLDRYFDNIAGSPTSKGDIIASFVKDFRVSPLNTVMVGDQPADQHAAAVADVGFVGFVPADMPSPFDPNTIVATVFDDLDSAISQVIDR